MSIALCLTHRRPSHRVWWSNPLLRLQQQQMLRRLLLQRRLRRQQLFRGAQPLLHPLVLLLLRRKCPLLLRPPRQQPMNLVPAMGLRGNECCILAALLSCCGRRCAGVPSKEQHRRLVYQININIWCKEDRYVCWTSFTYSSTIFYFTHSK
jgi:hypothetical protein